MLFFKLIICQIGDIIPVDLVADYIITVGALMANSYKDNIFQASSSSKNPVTWEQAQETVVIFIKFNKIQ